MRWLIVLCFLLQGCNPAYAWEQGEVWTFEDGSTARVWRVLKDRTLIIITNQEFYDKMCDVPISYSELYYKQKDKWDK